MYLAVKTYLKVNFFNTDAITLRKKTDKTLLND